MSFLYALPAHSTADVADAVTLNINVPSYKKLLEKNMFNDLSSPTTADKSV